MSRFRQELKIIPGTARFIAVFVYIVTAVAFALFVAFSHDQGLANTPRNGKASDDRRCGNRAGDLGAAHRLRVRRCEAPRHALRDVDSAGDFHSGRDRR